MKNAVIYGRTSEMGPNFHEKISIDAQIYEIEGYCERKNYEIVETFVDKNYSGGNDNRPDFNLMFAHLEKHHKEIDAVIVYNLSRFSRNLTDLKKYLKILDKLDIDFLSVMEPFCELSGSARGFMINILGSVAELQREQNAEVVRSAMMLKSRQGKHMGGKVPYGYSLNRENGKYEIVEEKAEIVRYIFNSYMDGKNPTQITEEIKSARAKSEMKLNESSIATILTNEKYTGKYEYGKRKNNPNGDRKKRKVDQENWVVINNNHPPIISRETFDLVQKERVKRRIVKNKVEDKKPTKGQKLLTGLVKCSCCGSHYYVSSSTRNYGDYYYYMCSNKKCPHKKVRKIQLETIVLQTILEVFDPEVFKDLYRREYDKVLERINISLENDRFTHKKIQDLIKEKNIYLNVIRDEISQKVNILTDDYKERVSKINKQISTLEDQVHRNNIKFLKGDLPSYSQIFEVLDDSIYNIEFLQTFSFGTIKNLVKYYIEEIVITDINTNESSVEIIFKQGAPSVEFNLKRGQRNLPDELEFSDDDYEYDLLILVTNVIVQMKEQGMAV
ncbi:recombinase family protein [Aquibacillus koreensis]|uniref:Recombinase family protein n=1 Tax=Aquibacillus koreensis TaxID=279446 RepID=A0A9X3WJ94_9BACI|nr:recombinase family protein [Aquibacillus koreensis]MCT2536551.1 recombinase family protein [Aquibacillus koreensis]MDC3419361.1 recombinase family protein [Aquibacillus koreensis]